MSAKELLAPVMEGEKRADAYRVLFVCTGNTCRSPMAAAVWNAMAAEHGYGEGAHADSAGLYAAEGAPMTPEAIAALRRDGIEPDARNSYLSHRARTVRAQDMALADAVVPLTRAHAMELMLRFPEAATKITVLPTDIADPYGGDGAVYEQCLADLKRAIGARFFGEEHT